MTARKLRNDLTGRKFGMLSVISLNGRDKGGRAMWLCRCDCGEEIIAEGHNLQVGHTTSCGCIKYTEKYGKDILGVKFGRAIAMRQYSDDNKGTMIECLCDCGTIFSAHRYSLLSGNTLSCGCYHKEKSIEASFKHGMTGTRMHDIWSGLKSRCSLKTNYGYKNYGGRGISVCDEWLADDGFLSFYDWSINNGYAESLTIDRIDNSLGYTPENCRWVDMEVQCNNTRKNLHIEYKGESKTLAQWVKYLGIKYSKTYCRIYKLGWSVEKAFEI